AVTSDGAVIAWGYNDAGQCMVPSGMSNIIAVAAGDAHSLALQSGGTVLAWGPLGQVAVPDGLSNVVAIAAGSGHSLALKSDGSVVGWGGNIYGESAVPTGL